MPASLLIAAGPMGPTEWLLIIGAVGVFVIIAQRDYQRYKLQKAAVEKGLSLLPTGAPIWLASLKTGILVLALGIGLITMGTIGLANLPDPAKMQPGGRDPNKLPIPTATRPADTQGSQPSQPQPPIQGENFRPGPGMQGGPGPNGPPNGPGFDGPNGRPPLGPDGRPIPLGPDGRPIPRQQMQGQPGFAGGPNEGPRGPAAGGNPPPPNPQIDAADARKVCHVAIGAGGVLSIVGLALTFFSLYERKHVKPVSGETQK